MKVFIINESYLGELLGNIRYLTGGMFPQVATLEYDLKTDLWKRVTVTRQGEVNVLESNQALSDKLDAAGINLKAIAVADGGTLTFVFQGSDVAISPKTAGAALLWSYRLKQYMDFGQVTVEDF